MEIAADRQQETYDGNMHGVTDAFIDYQKAFD